MKPINAKIRKLMRGISSVLALAIMTLSFSSQASARLLFQDDLFHEIESEGLNINFDDGGDEDVTLKFGNDGTDATIVFDDGTGDLTFTAVADGDAFNFDNGTLTTTADAGLDFRTSDVFAIRQDADPSTNATCSFLGELIYDTTDTQIQYCTTVGVGAAGIFSPIDTAGSANFEDIYANDGDNTLTTSNGNFTVAAGTGNVQINSGGPSGITVASDAAADDLTLAVTGATDSSVVISSAGTGTDAIDINATAGGITVDSAGVVALTNTGANNFNITAGQNLVLDDGTLTGTVQLSNTDTDWAATFADDGIVDVINSFTSTATGEGASNVGIEDASSWFTGAELEAALNEIEALFGATTSSTFNFTEDNVLADNDNVYSALNKLDLKWGDLANTANGEGASLVGVEDSAGNYTATNVEGVLTEIAGQIGSNAPNVDEMTFEPEYPNYVVFSDGSANKGKLVAEYDSTNREHYYRWTSRQAADQDIDIRFRYELPADFSATGDMRLRFRTGLTTSANNTVAVTLRNETDGAGGTTCHADPATAGAVADTWETLTITAAEIGTGCTAGTVLDAGDIIEVQLKLLADNTASAQTDVGTIEWDYTN